jgi:2-amino-4-hydroxy-6-hydroxymethyldihydropteridine diphosphokinase
MVTAFIGLGSNLGDRESNIFRAIDLLRQERGIAVVRVSTLVETRPVGPIQDQPPFINGVIAVETTLKPLQLLDSLLSIEQRLGRIRKERWGPRTIDLDILLYGNVTFNHPRLKIPHPEIPNRPFIEAALQELRHIAPLTRPAARPLPPRGAR